MYNTMIPCQRCGGTVVHERTTYKDDPWQDRCLNCGDINSNLITRNRREETKRRIEEALLEQTFNPGPVPEYQDVA
jgi:uncharacterized Zn finger protein